MIDMNKLNAMAELIKERDKKPMPSSMLAGCLLYDLLQKNIPNLPKDVPDYMKVLGFPVRIDHMLPKFGYVVLDQNKKVLVMGVIKEAAE